MHSKTRVIVVNGAFTMGARKSRRILKRAAQHADIILGCEFKYVDASRVLDPKRWVVVQDTSSDDRQGSLVAVRKTTGLVVQTGIFQGVQGKRSRGGVKGMLDRWFVWADVSLPDHEAGTIRFIAGHLPPKRHWDEWPEMIEALRQFMSRSPHPVVVGCDWNKLGRAVSAATGLVWRGTHIIGAAVTPGLRISKADRTSVGSDHPAVVATLT